MNPNLRNIYKTHHKTSRPSNFSIMKEERGDLISKFVGKGKKILDIGCRDGALTKYFVEGNKVLGIDVDDRALSEAGRNLGIETMNIDLNGEWNELYNRKFDAVVAGEVLEHLYYPDKVIKKVKKHLNEKGVFIGSVPNAFSYRNRLRYLMGTKKHTPLSDPTHINQFSCRDIEDLLKRYFHQVEIVGLGRFKKLSRRFPSAFSFVIFFKAND